MEQLVRLVQNGTSVDVVGHRLSGRSELLARARAALEEDGARVVQIRGISTAVPMGALKMSPIYLAASAGPTSLQEMPIEKLLRLASSKAIVIFADDANLLDEATRAAIETVHYHYRAPVVAARPPWATSVPNQRLFRSLHPVIQIALTELAPDATHALLEGHLGDRVGPELSSQIHTLAGGRPGLALAIAASVSSSGAIRRGRLGWKSTGDLWSPDLNGIYDDLIRCQPPSVQTNLETLSLAGAGSYRRALDLIGQSGVEELEERGLAKAFTMGERSFVAVSPPGLAVYYTKRPTTVRHARILGSIGQRIVTAAASVDQTPAVPALFPPPPLSIATNLYAETRQAQLCAAQSAWTRTPSLSAAIQLLTVQLEGDEQLLEADHLDSKLLADAPPLDELEFRYLLSRLRLSQSRPIEEVLDALCHQQPNYPYSPALEALRIGVRAQHGSPSEADLASLNYMARLDGPNGAVATLVLSHLKIVQSQAREALELLHRNAADIPFLRVTFEAAKGLSLYACGQFAEAARFASAHLETAAAKQDRSATAAHSYVAVLSHMALGQLDVATAVADLCVSTGVRAAATMFPSDRALHYARATLATRADQQSLASSLTDLAERIGGDSVALPLGHRDLVLAASLMAKGSPQEAGQLYRQLAHSLHERGFRLAAECAKLLEILSDFNLQEATQFRAIAKKIGGPLFIAYIDARAALANSNPRHLLEAACRLRALGAFEAALRYVTQAAKLYQQAGEHQQSITTRLLLEDFLEEAPMQPGLVSLDVGLTERELEIIGAVAEGQSNADIANRLNLSVRTVETHLRNIRRKTGAIDRKHLAVFAR